MLDELRGGVCFVWIPGGRGRCGFCVDEVGKRKYMVTLLLPLVAQNSPEVWGCVSFIYIIDAYISFSFFPPPFLFLRGGQIGGGSYSTWLKRWWWLAWFYFRFSKAEDEGLLLCAGGFDGGWLYLSMRGAPGGGGVEGRVPNELYRQLDGYIYLSLLRIFAHVGSVKSVRTSLEFVMRDGSYGRAM